MDTVEKIFKLSEVHARQTNFTNKIWLTLAFISIIAIMPIDNSSNEEKNGVVKEDQMELPFDLGLVDKTDYYPFTLLLISILLIGYGSAHIQSFRAGSLIFKYIKDEAKDDEDYYRDLKDIMDCAKGSTFNRVGPVAQILLGQSQFFNRKSISDIKIYISMVLYIVLKLATFFIIYFIPLYGLKKTYFETQSIISLDLWLPTYLFPIFALLALLVIMFTFLTDFCYMCRGAVSIKKPTHNSGS